MTMRTNRRSAAQASLAACLAAAACAHHYIPAVKEHDPIFARAAATLDKMKWFVDAYGNATISTPLLVQPDDSFKFNLTQATPDSFFASEKNKINGRSAGATAEADVAGASLSTSLNVEAMQQYLAALASYR